jgi:hypothetical protein
VKEQDERTVVLRAQEMARESLSEHGRVMPGAVMLVGRDPETGEPLASRHAIGMTEAQPFGSQEDFDEFVEALRTEAERLDATAVAIIGEATADIVDGAPARVALIRVEDEGGVDLVHAKIDDDRVGSFVDSPGAPDIFEQPILAARPR